MNTLLVHDLIRINPTSVMPACLAEPAWVQESLREAPWCVVRRVAAPAGKIAVGVRGHERNQRWGAFLNEGEITRSLPPSLLRSEALSSSRLDLQAFRALRMLEESLGDLGLSWGPGGSVAFEIATGLPTVGIASDLDLVVRCPDRLEIQRAAKILEATLRAPGRVDVRMETPVGGFALEEYCRPSTDSVLVRTATGSLLLRDPWETHQP